MQWDLGVKTLFNTQFKAIQNSSKGVSTEDLDVNSEVSSLDKHRSVAVDDWQLLPVLTQELTWFQNITHGNSKVYAMNTYMYVPNQEQLEMIVL